MTKRTVKHIDDAVSGVNIAMIGGADHPATADAVRIIYNLLRDNSKYLDLDTSNKRFGELLLNKYYKGIAKCDFRYDEYNYMTGREIAEKRCCDKYEEAINKRLIAFLKDIYRTTAALEELLFDRGTIEYCNSCEVCDGCCESEDMN